jgi:hypothetical protein
MSPRTRCGVAFGSPILLCNMSACNICTMNIPSYHIDKLSKELSVL